MQYFRVKAHCTRLLLPLAQSVIEAGFPSPAEGMMDGALDLNELLIEHPNATYFVRVRGDSMCGAGISHGDLLIVDRARQARSGDVIVAALNGSFTVKRWRLSRKGKRPSQSMSSSRFPERDYPVYGELVPEHPHFSTIPVGPEDEFMIWGVVRYVIHRP